MTCEIQYPPRQACRGKWTLLSFCDPMVGSLHSAWSHRRLTFNATEVQTIFVNYTSWASGFNTSHLTTLPSCQIHSRAGACSRSKTSTAHGRLLKNYLRCSYRLGNLIFINLPNMICPVMLCYEYLPHGVLRSQSNQLHPHGLNLRPMAVCTGRGLVAEFLVNDQLQS